MRKTLILLTMIITSVCILTGCEEKENAPQQKVSTFTYADREGKPLPVEEQMIGAAQNGDLAHIKALHGQGASLSLEYNGKTPFQVATENRQGVVLQYLLDNGIDPDTPWGRGSFKSDPLTKTVEAGWFEGVKLLVAKGANVNKHVDDGEDKYAMPLYFRALVAGHLGIAQFMVDNGADPAYRRADGYTALFAVIDDDPPGKVSSPDGLAVRENLPAVRLAVENGADINATCRGVTPLIMAAVYGKKEIYDYLVSQGADPKKKDAYGNTPAEYYTRTKLHPEQFGKFYEDRALAAMITPDVPLKTIQALVDEKYADINKPYAKEYTPLILAAVYQRKDIYDFLVKSGVDVSWTDPHGNRAEGYLTGGKKHPGSLFTAYYAKWDGTGETAKKARPDTPQNYRVLVKYSGHPIKLYINGTLVKNSAIGWSAILDVSGKDYIKKGENTVRITWGAMPGEPGWDAATARYNDPSYVSIGLKAQYDKDGNDLETVLWKNISLADALTIEGTKVPAYEFSFHSH